MLAPRIIPCLLVKDQGLVKSTKFRDYRYVGDPINAVKIFNEKEVDELVILDIDASAQEREPDYKMIQDVAHECRMPLCYGGGVRTVEQIRRIIQLGVEKVAIGRAAQESPDLIVQGSRTAGSQSIVVILDVKRVDSGHEVFTRNGTSATGRSPLDVAQHFERLGAGEIIVNSIDDDGVMQGYDLKLADQMRRAISVPLTVLGGAGSLEHIRQLLSLCGHVGSAAGSLFVFKGKFKAVLINYPTGLEKQALIARGIASIA